MYILIFCAFQASPQFGFLWDNLNFASTERVMKWSCPKRCKGLFVQDAWLPCFYGYTLLQRRIWHVPFGWEPSQENQNVFCLFVFCNPVAVVPTSFWGSVAEGWKGATFAGTSFRTDRTTTHRLLAVTSFFLFHFEQLLFFFFPTSISFEIQQLLFPQLLHVQRQRDLTSLQRTGIPADAGAKVVLVKYSCWCIISSVVLCPVK